MDFYKQLENNILLMPTEEKIEVLKEMGINVSQKAIDNSKIKREEYLKKVAIQSTSQKKPKMQNISTLVKVNNKSLVKVEPLHQNLCIVHSAEIKYRSQNERMRVKNKSSMKSKKKVVVGT